MRSTNLLTYLLTYLLRVRSHNKTLMCKTSDLNERNFLVRVIYKDCY